MTTDIDLPLPITRQDWIDAALAVGARAADRPDPDVDAERQALHDLERETAERAAWLATWPDRIPARFRDAHADQIDGDLADIAAEWDGLRNVLLLGSVGVGKTHAAIAIARTAFDDGRSVMFRPSVQLLDDLRPGGSDRALDDACTCDVLVLDDLGVERPTDWTAERLYLIVNERWLQARPTIATSNLPAVQLEAACGTRMWSRLWHGASVLELSGHDRRRSRP